MTGDVLKYYKHNAEKLASQYDTLRAADVHRCLKKHLSKLEPGIACDIGAGTGRDAHWLVEQGWEVVAVEPCKELREESAFKSHSNIHWVNDKLPALKELRKAGHKFNLILLSAVWMHIPEKDRARSFRILTDMLAPDGLLVISLRHGKDKKENQLRGFHPVSVEELEGFAKQRAVAVIDRFTDKDKLARQAVHWETVVFKLPDDGTGSLPLLRHIIVNDDKASTYKLGLLRTLLRIAEGAPGMVIKRTDSDVTIPFGLVGLYWLKLYMPLVLKSNLIQTPKANHEAEKGYGWAKVDFWSLRDVSAVDLRVGATFAPDQAKRIIGAIQVACSNIQAMPANYITYPGQNRQVFKCERNTVRAKNQHWQINKETLAQFGTFTIPSDLWQTLGQYACWVEPAIVNEWSSVMQGYQTFYDKTVFLTALQWDEAKRDTRLAQQQAEHIQQEGGSLNCVWTETNLKNKHYHIDHCFPWARWFNNDLWNLMPASVKANSSKGDKLPSAPLMADSKLRILDWWERGYVESSFKEQFFLEAEAALPMFSEKGKDLESIFEAMLHQRLRLKENQQLVEW